MWQWDKREMKITHKGGNMTANREIFSCLILPGGILILGTSSELIINFEFYSISTTIEFTDQVGWVATAHGEKVMETNN